MKTLINPFYTMDINHHNKLTNNSWNHPELVIEEPILPHHHHQVSFGSFWPNYPLETHHQLPSSSSNHIPCASTIFADHHHDPIMEAEEDQEEKEPEEELGAMKEMMYKIAAMQPVDIDPDTIRRPKRKNVRISDDPQSVAARHRRERISEKIRILQRLVPGGTKMDTASMLDEAIHYVKFLKRQIRLLQHPQCNNIGVSSLLVPTGDHQWPFTPNKLHGSSTSMDPLAGPGLINFGGENLGFQP